MPLTQSSLKKLKVAELREILSGLGQETKGLTKQNLISAILSSDESGDISQAPSAVGVDAIASKPAPRRSGRTSRSNSVDEQAPAALLGRPGRASRSNSIDQQAPAATTATKKRTPRSRSDSAESQKSTAEKKKSSPTKKKMEETVIEVEESKSMKTNMDNDGENKKSETKDDNATQVLSLSIAETNALRLKLGLKPLNVDSSEEKKGSSRNPEKATSLSTSSALDQSGQKQKERLEEAKLRRKERERVQSSIADSAEDLSANDWVKSMRNKSKKEKKVAKKELKAASAISTVEGSYEVSDEELMNSLRSEHLTITNERTNSLSTFCPLQSNALSGMTVIHSAQDFEAGTDTILTLKDESILTRTAGGLVDDINEGGNELENVNIADEFRSADAIKKRREVAQQVGAGGYTGFDDDEFEELGGSGRRGVLSKYDEKKGSKKGFTIGEGGAYETSTGQSEDAETRLFGAATSLIVEGESTFASDYMTEAEAAAKKSFKKKKKDKKERKSKKSKKRERDPDDGDDNGEGSGEDQQKQQLQQQSSLLAELEATAVGLSVPPASGNKRKRADSMDVDDEGAVSKKQNTTEMSNNRKRFDAAMKKGRERSEELFKKQMENKGDGEGGGGGKGGIAIPAADEVDDDAEVRSVALARGRRGCAERV